MSTPSLIICAECGREGVSSLATQCPECGKTPQTRQCSVCKTVGPCSKFNSFDTCIPCYRNQEQRKLDEAMGICPTCSKPIVPPSGALISLRREGSGWKEPPLYSGECAHCGQPVTWFSCAVCGFNKFGKPSAISKYVWYKPRTDPHGNACKSREESVVGCCEKCMPKFSDWIKSSSRSGSSCLLLGSIGLGIGFSCLTLIHFLLQK